MLAPTATLYISHLLVAPSFRSAVPAGRCSPARSGTPRTARSTTWWSACRPAPGTPTATWPGSASRRWWSAGSPRWPTLRRSLGIVDTIDRVALRRRRTVRGVHARPCGRQRGMITPAQQAMLDEFAPALGRYRRAAGRADGHRVRRLRPEPPGRHHAGGRQPPALRAAARRRVGGAGRDRRLVRRRAATPARTTSPSASSSTAATTGRRPQGQVTAVCTPLHVGRTMSIFEIVITDENDRRTCTARLTCAIRPAHQAGLASSRLSARRGAASGRPLTGGRCPRVGLDLQPA